MLHHHERYDGKGYPAGLVREEIPLGSRIVAIVDAFDAMLSSRAYRDALPVEEAVGRLVADTGKQFDPKIAPLFIELARSHMPELLSTSEELPVGLARVLR